MYEALFTPHPHKSLGTRLLAVVLCEGTCQELEPKWLHPIVDDNTVQQVVGLVVCATSVPDEWVYQRSHYIRDTHIILFYLPIVLFLHSLVM